MSDDIDPQDPALIGADPAHAPATHDEEVDARAPGSEDIDPLHRAFERNVAPVTGDNLLELAKVHRDVHARRRRRRVSLAVSGAAVAIIVGIVATMAMTKHDDGVHVGISIDYVADEGQAGTVRVWPGNSLQNGQTVTVTAYGFSAGSTVAFYECVRADANTQPPRTIPMQSADANDAHTSDQGSWWCFLGTPKAPTAVARPGRKFEPTKAVAAMTLSTDTSKLAQIIDRTGRLTPMWTGMCQGAPAASHCMGGVTPRSELPPTLRNGSCSGADAQRCVIIAVGRVDQPGLSHVFESAPLDFDADSRSTPTS